MQEIVKRINSSSKNESHKFVMPLKNWVDWTSTRREEKCHNLNNVHFKKNYPKVKNHIILSLDGNFYNFVLNIDTSWVTGVVKPILETRNVNVTVYVWFIHSWRIILNVQDLQKKKKLK